jgi:Protein of unknown function (DUF3006)
MRQVVDRIVNAKAVLLDSKGRQQIVPLKKLPRGLKEGDILIDGKIDRAEAAKARGRVRGLLDQIFSKKKPPRGGK